VTGELFSPSGVPSVGGQTVHDNTIATATAKVVLNVDIEHSKVESFCKLELEDVVEYTLRSTNEHLK
jgi:hypothetical protein